MDEEDARVSHGFAWQCTDGSAWCPFGVRANERVCTTAANIFHRREKLGLLMRYCGLLRQCYVIGMRSFALRYLLMLNLGRMGNTCETLRDDLKHEGFLEPSWAVLGRLGSVLGRLGGSLGASWGPLLSSRRACPAAQALPCGHRLDGFQLEARAAAGRGPEAVGGRVGRGRNSEQPLIPAPPRARSASRPRTERGQSRSRPRSPAPRDRRGSVDSRTAGGQ